MPPVVVASLVVFLEVLSLGAIFPVLPKYCQELGVAPDEAGLWAGLLFAIVAAPRVFMNTVWGRLSDRWGRKPALALITFGTLSGSALWALSEPLHAATGMGLLWLGISRFVAGFFQAQAALTQAVAADVTSPEKRAAAMGHLGAAFGFGMLGGIAMGGVVGTHIGLAAVGWASAIAQGLSLLAILFLLKETHPHKVDGATSTPDQFKVRAPRQLIRHRPIRHLLVVMLIVTAGHMVLVPTLPLITEAYFNFDVSDTAWAFGIWMFVGVLIQGGAIRPTVRRLGEGRTVQLGLAILAVGFAVIAGLPLMGGTPPLPAFWVGAVLIAIGGSFADPSLRGLLSQTAAGPEQGSVQGLGQSAIALGRALAYFMGGVLYDTMGPDAPYAYATFMVTLALLLFSIRRPESQMA